MKICVFGAGAIGGYLAAESNSSIDKTSIDVYTLITD
jgi:ketopantoate reductase